MRKCISEFLKFCSAGGQASDNLLLLGCGCTCWETVDLMFNKKDRNKHIRLPDYHQEDDQCKNLTISRLKKNARGIPLPFT